MEYLLALLASSFSWNDRCGEVEGVRRLKEATVCIVEQDRIQRVDMSRVLLCVTMAP
jgi:hypothetical protein